MLSRFFVFAFSFAFISLPSFAGPLKPTKPPRDRIRAGTEITIAKYIAKAETFEIVMTHETSQGPNYCRPEDLKEAISMEGSVKEFIKLATKDFSAIYVLKKDLPLLWPEEVVAREHHKK